MVYFNKNKVYDKNKWDIVIEMIALTEDNLNIECVFVTLCKIHPDIKK